MTVKTISQRRAHDASRNKIITDADLLFAVTKRPGEQFGIGFRPREDVTPLEYLEGIAAIIELVASAWGHTVEETLEAIRKNMAAYPCEIDEVVELDEDGNVSPLTRN
jgi:hypothetical protein